MRTKIILSFIAALLMQFVNVRADGYSDGIMKLINSDAMGSFNAKMFEQMSQIPSVNAGYIQGQFKTDANGRDSVLRAGCSTIPWFRLKAGLVVYCQAAAGHC